MCAVVLAAAWGVVKLIATVVWWGVLVRVRNMIVIAIATRTPSAVAVAAGLIRTRGVSGSMGSDVNMVCSVLVWAAVRPGGLMVVRARFQDCDRQGLQRADGWLTGRLRSLTELAGRGPRRLVRSRGC